MEVRERGGMAISLWSEVESTEYMIPYSLHPKNMNFGGGSLVCLGNTEKCYGCCPSSVPGILIFLMLL